MIPIPSDPTEEGREDETADGTEADSDLRQLDLDNLVRATRGQSSASSAQDIIGTSRAAPTSYRKKQYTHLPELERWQLANECTDILIQRVWERPHEQFEAMKKATDNFLVKHQMTLKVNS